LLKIDSIKLQGFGSYMKPCTLNFTEDAGFYLVTGRNDVEPDLGANGSGKSTAFEAIVWCLYGKTSQGLKAASIGNWKNNKKYKTEVTLTFTLGDDSYVLRRTWKPNTLLLSRNGEDPQATDNDKVEDLVGCSFAVFLRTVYQSQHNLFFLELSPTEKLSVFTDVLNLNKWLKSADLAKEKLNEVKDDLAQANNKLSNKRGKRSALKEQLDSLKEKQSDLKAELGDRDAVIKGLIAEAKAKLKKVRAQGKTVQAEHAEKKELGRAFSDATDRAYEACELAKKVLSELKVNLGIAQNEKQSMDKQYNKVKKEVICPTCNQAYPKDERDKLMHHLKRDANLIIANKISPLEKNIRGAEKRLASDTTDLEKARAEEKVTRHRTQKLHENLQELKRARTALLKDIEHWEQEQEYGGVKAMKALAQQIKEVREQRASLKDEIDTLKRKVKGLETDVVAYDYWPKGFKQVRLFIVEQALQEFEVSINNSLVQLGMSDWKVTLSAERTTRNKAVSKGFHVYVQAPHATKEVPFSVWSGGEAQRLKLASEMGLAELVKARSGFDCNLRVYDEPTNHLSSEGIDDLLEFFSGQTLFQDGLIFMIDHRSLDFGGFDQIYCAVKDNNGSRIESE